MRPMFGEVTKEHGWSRAKLLTEAVPAMIRSNDPTADDQWEAWWVDQQSRRITLVSRHVTFCSAMEQIHRMWRAIYAVSESRKKAN